MAGCPRLVRTMSKLISAVCVAGVLMAPGAALAHHSGAMFETKKTVTVTGTVTTITLDGRALSLSRFR